MKRAYTSPTRKAREVNQGKVAKIGPCTHCGQFRELKPAMEGQLCATCMADWMDYVMSKIAESRGQHGPRR